MDDIAATGGTAIARFVSARLAEAQERAGAMGHFTVYDDTYLSRPASRTEPFRDLPYGDDACDCGLAERKARALRTVAAHRAILAMYTQTLAVKELPFTARSGTLEATLRARDYMDAERELAALKPVMAALAAIDSDHPEYHAEEWKP